MIVKAVITYSDGQEVTYTGENIIPGSLPHAAPTAAPVEEAPAAPVADAPTDESHE